VDITRMLSADKRLQAVYLG